jgi:4'-phosphopantetheinyl transferase
VPQEAAGSRVLVYWAQPQQAPSPALLSDSERARLATFRDDAARRSFMTGRLLLRIAAGRWLGVPADQVRIDARCARCPAEHGPPRLLDAPGSHASVAHCEGRAVVALADRVAVGVDVEPRTAANFVGFEDVALSAQERARLAATSPGDRAAQQTRMWVRKEAVVKLTGAGLSRDPDTIDSDDPTVRFRELDLGAGYYAVVALPATVTAEIEVIDLTPVPAAPATSLSSPTR